MGFEGDLDGKDHAWLQWFFLLPITDLWSLLPSCCLWSEDRPVLGTELVLCVGTGRGRVNPTQHGEGKESPFPFACPHPAARSCLGCTCPAPGAVDMSAALCWEG